MDKGKEAIFFGKKIPLKGSTQKNILAQATGPEKKYIASQKLPTPPSPHHFSNGPSLTDQLTPSSSYTPYSQMADKREKTGA